MPSINNNNNNHHHNRQHQQQHHSKSRHTCCAVCGGPRGGFFFGVHSCRPCASFFRRSVREGRQYVCRQQGNCAIEDEGMRNSCRHCRLKRCLRAGMNTEQAISNNNSKISDCNRSNHVSSSSNGTATVGGGDAFADCAIDSFNQIASSNMVTLNFPMQTPLACHLAQSLKEYVDGVRAVCAQQYGPGVVLAGNPCRLITHVESLNLERIGAPLSVNLAQAMMPTFDLLAPEQKMCLMKDFVLHFYMLISSEWTDKEFRTQNELNQVVLFPGCVMDKNKYEQFFEGTRGFGKEQHLKIGQPLLERHLQFIQHRYRPLDVSHAEVAILTAILFWDCAINCLGLTSTPKDALFTELHTLCIQHALRHSTNGFTVNAIPIRFGQLTSLLIELTILSKELKELFALSDVFLNERSFVNFTEIWDEIFGRHPKPTTTRMMMMRSEKEEEELDLC